MLTWSDKYLVGKYRIDFEHKIFLDLIVDFEKARLRGAGKEELQDILQEIVLYAKFHFRSEENMMRRMEYPHLASHQDMHLHLIDILNNKIIAYDMGSIDPVAIQDFLVEWFVKHTTHEDPKILAYQNAQSR